MPNTSTKLNDRIQRWRRFFDVNQPPTHMLLIRLNNCETPRPFPCPDNIAERIEWAWHSYLELLDRVEWLNDDTIPRLHVYTGTEIFAEAFGCPVHRSNDDMPFALPLVHCASEVSRIKVPDVSSSTLAMLFDIADELRRRGGREALLQLVDIQSPMDIAALIWEKRGFYAALIDEPDAVKELAAKATELLTNFLDQWFARYGKDYVAHHPDYFMSGGITLSEDEIGVVSSEVFEDLFIPELIELSKRYGGIGIHCCANAKHQWSALRRIPNLRLLNLDQPAEICKQAYQFFKSYTPQMHSWCGDGHPFTWKDQLPRNSRVILQVPVDSKDVAKQLADGVRSLLENDQTKNQANYHWM